MIRVSIQAGTCGFATTVTARSEDQRHVTLAIESGCEKIRGLALDLASTIDAYQEIGNGHDGLVLKAARKHLNSCCFGCIVRAACSRPCRAQAELRCRPSLQ